MSKKHDSPFRTSTAVSLVIVITRQLADAIVTISSDEITGKVVAKLVRSVTANTTPTGRRDVCDRLPSTCASCSVGKPGCRESRQRKKK